MIEIKHKGKIINYQFETIKEVYEEAVKRGMEDYAICSHSTGYRPCSSDFDYALEEFNKSGDKEVTI